ncbi:MAG: hypothetical protein ACM3ML_27810 [Micromonosporaceae bacterium]
MTQPMQLEDYVEDGHYVVRAGLPGAVKIYNGLADEVLVGGLFHSTC